MVDEESCSVDDPEYPAPIRYCPATRNAGTPIDATPLLTTARPDHFFTPPLDTVNVTAPDTVTPTGAAMTARSTAFVALAKVVGCADTLIVLGALTTVNVSDVEPVTKLAFPA